MPFSSRPTRNISVADTADEEEIWFRDSKSVDTDSQTENFDDETGEISFLEEVEYADGHGLFPLTDASASDTSAEMVSLQNAASDLAAVIARSPAKKQQGPGFDDYLV